jgi:TetR/AcrR family transcriptional repressor of nem operon
MSRALKTDAESATLGAMMLFWRDGYHALGTRALESETGLTRFTLQTKYGGKKALFIKTLDLYLDLFDAYMLPSLRSGGLEGIAAWIEQRPVPDSFREALRNGCLMVNSITEFPRDDSAVNARADRYYGLLRAALVEALETARAKGELSGQIIVADAAEVLLALVVALNLSFKSKAPNADAGRIARAGAAMVRGWSA